MLARLLCYRRTLQTGFLRTLGHQMETSNIHLYGLSPSRGGHLIVTDICSLPPVSLVARGKGLQAVRAEDLGGEPPSPSNAFHQSLNLSVTAS